MRLRLKTMRWKERRALVLVRWRTAAEHFPVAGVKRTGALRSPKAPIDRTTEVLAPARADGAAIQLGRLRTTKISLREPCVPTAPLVDVTRAGLSSSATLRTSRAMTSVRGNLRAVGAAFYLYRPRRMRCLDVHQYRFATDSLRISGGGRAAKRWREARRSSKPPHRICAHDGNGSQLLVRGRGSSTHRRRFGG
jgi:hypothetical protein